MQASNSSPHLSPQRRDTAANGTLGWVDTIGLFGYSPYTVYNVLNEALSQPSTTETATLRNDMSAYFTQHHFPPRHSTIHEPQSDPYTPTTERDTTSQHRGLDVLAKLLHALDAFHLETSHSAVKPRCDLVETNAAFFVYGEFPGLRPDDLIVEANDQLFTVVISGLLKRPVPSGVATTDNGAVDVVHRASREGGSEAGKKPAGEGEAETEASGAQETHAENQEPDTELHWHATERKVGQFRRAFHFPVGQVDMAAVKASMRDGLMCLAVPKRLGENKKLTEVRKVEVAEAGV